MMLTATKSSLEEMLDSLRRRDGEKPKDLPPVLPTRPTSKARLPRARRTLPDNLKVDDVNIKGHRRKGSFGNKKMKMDVESPYIVKSEEKTMSEELPQGPVPKSVDSTASVTPPPGELEDDNVAYYIKKLYMIEVLQCFLVFESLS
ncbi:hypothetical protein Lalb_Chr25g0286751 [Lupinus albus]|uniref:Uncharacterized protein n=1 Tax=Lupinus albus TaxID=3870 RepID=A0A6A4NEZ2_LUPAL|nr:hypothetical protein Lalb_Chr25g0286751 [Lupinus albus]